jgi:Family of unknown function (DUF6157)
MKVHTTNYSNTFIEVAEDCPTEISQMPQSKGSSKTVAQMQFEMMAKAPYRYTSDEVFFQVYADRNDLTSEDYPEARALFFSKGQPCFRASPLTKRYGFGVHSDQEGKVALFAMESPEYQAFVANPELKKVKAMRTSKK